MDIIIFIFSTFFAGSLLNLPLYIVVLTGILLCFFGVYTLFLKGYYLIRKYDFFLKDAYHLLEGAILAMVVPAIVALFLKFDRTVFYFILINLGILYIFLLVWRVSFYEYRKQFKQAKNIIIIGAGYSGSTISAEILKRPELKFNIVGFVDNDENKLNTEINGIKVIGKTSDLKEIIDKNDIKLVIIAIVRTIERYALMDISECVPQGVDIFRMTDIYEKITQKIPVRHITPDWFIYDITCLETPFYDIIKRIFDIGAALIILILTFPVLVFIAIGIKIYDKGPVFYFQDRVGKCGKNFKLYKLRTMHQNADKEGMVDKGNTKDDRIIPFCRWIRKARFDEIPQMINIIKGEMSIVGPRAEFVDFVKEYEKQIPFYNRRHWITPGWTGWAQINQGHCVNVNDIIEKLGYDFYYIKHRNIFWDFSILLKAVGLALSGRHG
jgi:exopolysaccharide biosynthesis polyprenyl glycosylphosphotransferase